jgi:hypothetical protein
LIEPIFVDASRCAPEYFEEDAAFHYAAMALPARRLVPLLLGEDVNVKRLHPSLVAITRGPLRFLLVDFVNLLVGFFAFRPNSAGLHAAPQQLCDAESFWAREAEHPGFLPRT